MALDFESELALEDEAAELIKLGPKVVRLTHWQQLVKPHPSDPGKIAPGKIVPLHPNNMNPRSLDPWGGPDWATTDTRLQSSLEALLTEGWFNFLLANGKSGIPSQCDRVRVALVNLTGSRWFDPALALWGGTYPTEGASIGKVLVVYALFQLRFDLRVLAFLKHVTNPTELRKAARESWRGMLRPEDQPMLDALFGWAAWDGKPDNLDFNERTKVRLRAAIACNDDCAMGRLMVQVGFSFIGSVAFQSGLWEPLGPGGLWLSATFAGKALVEKKCPPPESCAGVNRSWSQDPYRTRKPLFHHNATALALAKFYTLLSQFRLVDQRSSLEIMYLLGEGCVSGPFHKAIATVAVASKCGVLLDFRKRLEDYGCKDSRESMVINDSALFFDKSVDPPLRYVIVIMSYMPRAYSVPRPGARPVPVPKGHPLHGYDYAKLVGRLENLVRY